MKTFILTHMGWINTAAMIIAKRYLIKSAPVVLHTIVSLGILTNVLGV